MLRAATSTRSPRRSSRAAAAVHVELDLALARACTRISIAQVRGSTSGRCVSVCGQIGVSTKASKLGQQDRPAGRERVGRRAGRRRDDQAVGAVGGHRRAVGAGLEVDHAREPLCVITASLSASASNERARRLAVDAHLEAHAPHDAVARRRAPPRGRPGARRATPPRGSRAPRGSRRGSAPARVPTARATESKRAVAAEHDEQIGARGDEARARSPRGAASARPRRRAAPRRRARASHFVERRATVRELRRSGFTTEPTLRIGSACLAPPMAEVSSPPARRNALSTARSSAPCDCVARLAPCPTTRSPELFPSARRRAPAPGSARRSPSACGRARSTRCAGRTPWSAPGAPAARAGRAGRAALADPLGAARLRQDDARAPARRAPGHGASRPSPPCSPGVKECARRSSRARASGARRPAHGALHRRDPPLQPRPAGRAAAARRGGHRDADRRHHREPLLRGDRAAALALPRLHAARGSSARTLARAAARAPPPTASAGLGRGGRACCREAAAGAIAAAADGDARRALGLLETAVALRRGAPGRRRRSRDEDAARGGGQARAALTTATARSTTTWSRRFIKSLRASDPDAALYWLARMLEAGEDPRFVARRLVIFASEDVGNAEPAGAPARDVRLPGRRADRHAGGPHPARAGDRPSSPARPKSNAVLPRHSSAPRRRSQRAARCRCRCTCATRRPALMKRARLRPRLPLPARRARRLRRDARTCPRRSRDARFYEPTERGAEGAIAERLREWRRRARGAPTENPRGD